MGEQGMDAAREPGTGACPRSRAELASWLEQELELTVPDRSLVRGHQAPMEYLAHAFFEPGMAGFEAGLPRDCVVWANRGGGKTFLAAVATLLDMLFKPGIEVRVLAGSVEQGRRMHTHLRTLLDRPSMRPLIDGRITERRVRLTNGSCVEVLAQSQTSVRGTRVQKLRCDEVELFDERVWEAAQLVTREKDCGGVLVRGSIECLSTMHLPYGLMHKLVKSCRGDTPTRRLMRWGVVDVLDVCRDDEHACATCALSEECAGRAKQRDGAGKPAGHVSVRDAVSMKARVGLSTWRAEMLCLRPRRTDSVLPEFDPHKHGVRDAPGDPAPTGELVCGMDFGIRSPTVTLWARIDEEGVITVLDERSASDVVLGEHADAIREHRFGEPAWIGVDPAGRQRSLQTGLSDADALRRAGLRVRDRRIGLAEGIRLLRARLAPASGEPRLFVHERCQRLIECLETYRYPADRPEVLQPIKDGSDHAVDALRYLIQNAERPPGARASSYL